MLLLAGACGHGRTTAGPAPTFQLDAVQAGAGPVAFAPGQPTVVNFFAAWCDPCTREVPHLEQVARSSPSVRFIGVDVADSRTNAADLLSTAGVTYPAGYDPDKTVARRYHVVGMPTSVFVKADGQIDAVVKGPISSAALQRRMHQLTGSA